MCKIAPQVERKAKSWGKNVEATPQVSCTQLQDLYKLCIKHVTTVFDNYTELASFQGSTQLSIACSTEKRFFIRARGNSGNEASTKYHPDFYSTYLNVQVQLYTVFFPLGMWLALKKKKREGTHYPMLTKAFLQPIATMHIYSILCRSFPSALRQVTSCSQVK